MDDPLEDKTDLDILRSQVSWLYQGTDGKGEQHAYQTVLMLIYNIQNNET